MVEIVLAIYFLLIYALVVLAAYFWGNIPI